MMEKVSDNKILIGIILGILLLCIILIFLIKGCTVKEYVVTFESNGGTAVASVKVRAHEQVSKPKDPVKEGYNFLGWYTDKELKKEFNFNSEITNDITLYAGWSALEKLELNVTSLNILIDKEEKIDVISLPSGVSLDQFVWTSSNDKIVTMLENGKIKALSEGEAIITIKTKDGKYTATCKVKVTKEKIDAESVTINGYEEVTIGDTIILQAIVKPDEATDKNVTWTSSNQYVATVDSYGRVTGRSEGTVVISATTSNGKKSSKTITVKKAPVINVTGVSINGDKEVYVGDTIKLEAVIKPGNATNKNVSWSSSDSNIATVDQNGRVTGKNTGTVKITVKTEDGGKTASKEISVKKKSNPKPTVVEVKSVKITGSSEMYVGDTVSLKVTINPSNATDKTVTWSITNGSGNASITQNGKVTANKVGTVTVKVTSKNGKTDTHTITIKEKPATYVLKLRKIDNELHSTIQYEGIIYKNGSPINDSDYKTILYNGTERTFKGNNKYITNVNLNVRNATIYLSDGTEANVTVEYS